MNDEQNLEHAIDKIFDDAWQEAPKIGGLHDLGEHIAKAIKEVSAEKQEAFQNLIVGKITIFDDDDDSEHGKGALELKFITASISPIHEMLEHYKPQLNIDEFIAVMTENDHGQLTMIAFANGCSLTTLTTDDDDEIGISDYDNTKRMFLDAGKDSHTLLRIFDRLIEIAKQ